MKTELFTSNLYKVKVHVKPRLDDDLSTIKQFVLDDALADIKTLLLVSDLSSSHRHALRSLRYKVNGMEKTYQACAPD